MSDTSFHDCFTSSDTNRSFNGPKPKLPGIQTQPKEDDEFILEGWCRDDKLRRNLREDGGLSEISETSYIWGEEDNKKGKSKAFKSTLAVLSDGLAAMHRRGVPTRPTSEIGKPIGSRAGKLRNNSTISTNNKKNKSNPKSRSSVGCQQEVLEKPILAELRQETGIEHSVVPTLVKARETGNSSRTSLNLPPFLEKLSPPHNTYYGENHPLDYILRDPIKAPERNINTNNYILKSCGDLDHQEHVFSLNQHNQQLPQTCITLDQDPKERFEVIKETPNIEYVLKPARPNRLSMHAARPSTGNDVMVVAKQNLLFHKATPLPIKEVKSTYSQRLSIFSSHEDTRANKNLLSKAMFSPANGVQGGQDSVKSSKADPMMPILKTQKAILISKEGKEGVSIVQQDGSRQSKMEGPRQNESRSKENRPNGNKSLSLSKKASEIGIGGGGEAQGKRESLRSVLGQVFNNNQLPPSYNVNFREVNKQPEYRTNSGNEENSRGMVEYILSLYKKGGEKAAMEKGKGSEQFFSTNSNGWSNKETVKKATELQAKMKQFTTTPTTTGVTVTTNETFSNNGEIGHEKGLKVGGLVIGSRLSVKGQSRNEIAFRLRKMKTSGEEKKITVH